MIGIAFESCRKICIGSASIGMRPRTRSRRMRMSSIASLRSVPHANESDTRLLPSDEVELSWSRPATALTVCSIGRVMSCSISCGPTPGYRTKTLTVG